MSCNSFKLWRRKQWEVSLKLLTTGIRRQVRFFHHFLWQLDLTSEDSLPVADLVSIFLLLIRYEKRDVNENWHATTFQTVLKHMPVLDRRLRLAPQFLSTFLVLGASRRHRTGLQLSSLTSHSCPASVHKIERNKRKVCWTRDVRRGRRPEACGSFYFLLTVSSRTLPSSNLPRVMPCGFLLSFHGIQLLDGLEGCGRQS